MAQVTYSDEAFTDFERIIEFLLKTSPEAAAQALDGIRSAIGILEAQPFSGRRVDGQIRELDVVRILRVRDQRWPGHRKQTRPF